MDSVVLPPLLLMVLRWRRHTVSVLIEDAEDPVVHTIQPTLLTLRFDPLLRDNNRRPIFLSHRTRPPDKPEQERRASILWSRHCPCLFSFPVAIARSSQTNDGELSDMADIVYEYMLCWRPSIWLGLDCTSHPMCPRLVGRLVDFLCVQCRIPSKTGQQNKFPGGSLQRLPAFTLASNFSFCLKMAPTCLLGGQLRSRKPSQSLRAGPSQGLSETCTSEL